MFLLKFYCYFTVFYCILQKFEGFSILLLESIAFTQAFLSFNSDLLVFLRFSLVFSQTYLFFIGFTQNFFNFNPDLLVLLRFSLVFSQMYLFCIGFTQVFFNLNSDLLVLLRFPLVFTWMYLFVWVSLPNRGEGPGKLDPRLTIEI